MKSILLKTGTAIALGVAVIATQPVLAGDDHSMAEHKIVFQVSSSDPATQALVLNNAVNIRKHYGRDNTDVVVVAYGPGLSILTAKNKQATRIKSLAKEGITFDACHNTMMKMKKKTGKLPVLTEGVKVVPAGVAQIIELQNKGYNYIRP